MGGYSHGRDLKLQFTNGVGLPLGFHLLVISWTVTSLTYSLRLCSGGHHCKDGLLAYNNHCPILPFVWPVAVRFTLIICLLLFSVNQPYKDS
jgi:hypothetical protein